MGVYGLRLHSVAFFVFLISFVIIVRTRLGAGKMDAGIGT